MPSLKVQKEGTCYVFKMSGARTYMVEGVAQAADKINAFTVHVRQSDTVALTGGLRACYFTVESGLAACNELKTIEAKVRANGANVTSAKVLAISLDAKTKTITTGRGIEISIDAKAGGAITTVEALRIANNSSGAHTKLNAVAIAGIWNAHISFGAGQALGSTTEGDLWYDKSDGLIKYRDSSATKTITVS